MSKLTIGPFTSGEVPSSLVYTFTGENLTTAAGATVRIRPPSGTAVERVATISDAAAGEVTYDWDADDLAEPGVYRLEVWVDDEIASPPILAYVRPAITVV